MTRATGPLYAVHFRRRREERTDYAKRLSLLKSFQTRLAVRKTNKYVTVQLFEFTETGDRVIASASSRELKKFGFEGKCNTPSAYLTGLLAGVRAKSKGVKKFVLDIGLHTSTKGGLVFAAAKGAIDSGVESSYSEEKFPSEERISGSHLGLDKEKFNAVKSKILSEVKQ